MAPPQKSDSGPSLLSPLTAAKARWARLWPGLATARMVQPRQADRLAVFQGTIDAGQSLGQNEVRGEGAAQGQRLLPVFLDSFGSEPGRRRLRSLHLDSLLEQSAGRRTRAAMVVCQQHAVDFVHAPGLQALTALGSIDEHGVGTVDQRVPGGKAGRAQDAGRYFDPGGRLFPGSRIAPGQPGRSDEHHSTEQQGRDLEHGSCTALTNGTWATQLSLSVVELLANGFRHIVILLASRERRRPE